VWTCSIQVRKRAAAQDGEVFTDGSVIQRHKIIPTAVQVFDYSSIQQPWHVKKISIVVDNGTVMLPVRRSMVDYLNEN
jgi:hypothetical protein